MSQEGRRISPRRTKSPSRIPVFNSAQRKRPASRITDNVKTKESPASSKEGKGIAGFKRLEALVKANAKSSVAAPQGQDHAQSSTTSGNPWVEKYLPQSLDDLFVHKKKVEEVSSWLSKALISKTDKICALSGPAGCGKTATIVLVAKYLEVDIKEWKNPMSLTDRVFIPGDFEANREEVQGRSELELFKDFLEINSHYRVLPINGRKMKSKRVIVVEDLPNGLYRDPNGFHEILRNYSKSGLFPLVLIFTDTANGDHSMYKMLPKTLMMELNLHNVSFNPVAPSLMQKFLKEICAKEGRPVDISQIEEIAVSANGDLRCAVNNLQFFLTKEHGRSTNTGFRKPPPKRSRAEKRRDSLKSSTCETQHKDDSLQLFKALGKVLYAKRDESAVSEVEEELKGDLLDNRRLHPLQEDPNSIAMKIEVLPDTFLGFLHQNYPAFYGSLDELKVAAEYLSVSDFMLTGWKFDDSGTRTFKSRDTKEQVSLNVAIRGLMHSNNNRISSGWKPLTKPFISNVNNYTRERIESTRQALYHLGELQASLFTETIPLYAKLIQLKPSCSIDGRKEIIEKGIFKHKFVRVESLDEKETVSDTDVNGSHEDADDTAGQHDVKSEELSLKLSSNDSNLDSNIADDEFCIEDFEDW